MSIQQTIQGYRDLAAHLRNAIVQGEYTPGSQLPGEIQISHTCGLNRHTVRAALAELEKEGLVYKVQGKGTFVAIRKIPYTLSPKTSFSATLDQLGLRGQPDLRSIHCIPGPREITRELGLRAKAPVWKLEILRRIEDFPVCLTTSWLSAERFPELDRHLRPFRSLYEVLTSKYDLQKIRRASSHIEAALPGKHESDLLGCSPQLPLLITHSLATDADNTPLEIAHSVARSDAYTLHVTFDT
ncbi:MAG: phosphonate metabolism transcriptional regulator PhnF [Kiritimatiellia bacterium]